MANQEATPERGETKREEFGALQVVRGGELSVSAAAEHSKALIQAKFIMAMQNRRNISDVRAEVLAACKRPRFAEKARYAKPLGGGSVRGPSIRFADEAARIMGNIDVTKRTVFEDAEIRMISVSAIDLETNVTKSEEIVISKTVERKNPRGRKVLEWRKNTKGEKVAVLEATVDEMLTKENAQVAKVRRQLELQLIPQDIIEEAMETAVRTVADRDAKDPAAVLKQIADAFFTNFGVKPSDLENLLRHPLDKTTPAEIQKLREVFQSMIQGEATWADFVASDDDPKPDKPSAKVASVQEKVANLRKENGNKEKTSPAEPGEGKTLMEVFGEEEKTSPAAPLGGIIGATVDALREIEGATGGPATPEEEAAAEEELEKIESHPLGHFLGPFVDPESMSSGTYRLLLSGKIDSLLEPLKKIGFEYGIKAGYGRKIFKAGLPSDEVSKWIERFAEYKENDTDERHALDVGAIHIEVVDEATGEVLVNTREVK